MNSSISRSRYTFVRFVLQVLHSSITDPLNDLSLRTIVHNDYLKISVGLAYCAANSSS